MRKNGGVLHFYAESKGPPILTVVCAIWVRSTDRGLTCALLVSDASIDEGFIDRSNRNLKLRFSVRIRMKNDSPNVYCF